MGVYFITGKKEMNFWPARQKRSREVATVEVGFNCIYSLGQEFQKRPSKEENHTILQLRKADALAHLRPLTS